MVVVEEIVPGDISHGWTPCQDEELTQRMKGELDVLREQMAELGAMSDGKPPFPVGREMPEELYYDGLVRNEEMQHDQTLKYEDGAKYEGDILGNMRHGYGVHKCINGDVYRGQWRLNKRHGNGRMVFKSGLEYDGEWEEDVACGRGKCMYQNGNIYTGEWRNDHRWGWGKIELPSGGWYEGEWRDDIIEGIGRWTEPDGSYFEGRHMNGERVKGRFVSGDGKVEYEGEWKGGMRHGSGILRDSSAGLQCKGQWIDDAMEGQGECRYSDGSVYHGGWKAGLRQGHGQLAMADGTTYTGAWCSNAQHGIGTCTYASSEKYTGLWADGRRSGKGKCVRANGDRYEGDWEGDKPHGDGRCSYANGDTYEGAWKSGQRHGFGTCVFADGKIFKGLWEEDGWVQSTAEPSKCKMSGAGLSRAVAGRTATFEVQAFDENGNERLCGGDDLRGRLEGPALVHCKVLDHGDGMYGFEYVAKVAGRYRLHCTAGASEEVEDSPYPVLVLPGPPSVRHCKVTGSGRTSATVGVPNYFVVEAIDEYGNLSAGVDLVESLPLQVELSLGGQPSPVEIKPVPKRGIFECHYTPEAEGFYRISVTTTNKRHLPGSPFSLRVEPARRASVGGAEQEGEFDKSGEDVEKANEDARREIKGEAKGLRDMMSQWMATAAAAFGEDGCMDGWDSDPEKPPNEDEEIAKANPGVPIVENLEDLWKVNKLQRERKAREKRNKAKRLAELKRELDLRYGTMPAKGSETSQETQGASGGASSSGAAHTGTQVGPGREGGQAPAAPIGGASKPSALPSIMQLDV